MHSVQVLADRVRSAIERFELEDASLQIIAHAPSLDHAVEDWSRHLSILKSDYRRRAFDTHPDRGGSEEEFKALARDWDTLHDPNFIAFLWQFAQRMLAEQKRPIRPQQFVHVRVRPGVSVTTSVTGSTTTSETIFWSY